MKKEVLSKEIEKRFERESKKVIDPVEDTDKHSQILTICISIIMASVILASVVYSLIKFIAQ